MGRTGSAPEDTKGHYETIRRYDVPAEHIRWNAENVIAVCVFDSDGDGGMHKGTPTLSEPVWTDFVSVDIDHGHADGIYSAGSLMDLSAMIRNTAFETLKGTVRFQVGSDTWLAEQREIFADISKPPAAGFYQVTCTFIRDGDETAISQSRMRDMHRRRWIALPIPQKICERSGIRALQPPRQQPSPPTTSSATLKITACTPKLATARRPSI